MPNELAEQLYDIFKQVVAARENLLDTHRGEIMRFAQGIEELSSRVRDWVAENQKPIQRFHASVMSIAAQLPEWRDNLEANRLLLERGFEMLESTGYRNVQYLVTLYEVAEFADLSPGSRYRKGRHPASTRRRGMLPVDVTPRPRTSACAGSRIRSALVEFDALGHRIPCRSRMGGSPIRPV